MFKSSTILFVLTLSVANCQFFYNYEEDSSDEPLPQPQNSPLNEQYVQPPSTENQMRITSGYSTSDSNPPLSPISTDINQERRKAKRRQKQRQTNYFAEPPLVASIFENIRLGEAPSGVYIPQDSFLNVLRNPSQSSVSLSAPQTINYVPASIGNTNRGFQSEIFASNQEATQPNLILPSARSRVEYNNVPLPPTTVIPDRNPSVVTGKRRKQSRRRIRIQPEYANPPTVDIDALREYSDDFDRVDVMPQVQYVPVNNRQNPRSQNRRRITTNYKETTPASNVYSPSVFEKIELGEAPNGVYVPGDSLLNVLRNPSRLHSSSRASHQEPQAYLLPDESEGYYQPTSTRRRPPENSRQTAPFIRSYPNENEDYQNVQTTPSRRRSPQNSRQTAPLMRSYPDEYEDSQNVQSIPSRRRSPQNSRQTAPSTRSYPDEYEDSQNVQPSSQRRSQRGGQNLPVNHQRSAASMPRTQPQAPMSSKTAKLAIAELPEDTDGDNIPGEAGVSYPTFHTIPKTTFSCSQQPHNGYYADLETSCQVVHLCQAGGVQNSFLCPNGTIFSQEKFSCQWWYKVNCNDAPEFYVKNDELYKVPVKKEKKRS